MPINCAAFLRQGVEVVESKTEYCATGRRKNAVCRVRLVQGSGKWNIDGRNLKDYFHAEALLHYIEQPIKLTNMGDKYDVIANLSGGGISGQAGALRHALARALSSSDKSLREVLKSSGCLTRDSRMKERKKPGRPGARKRFQFSKR
ncbi:MAG: 30S ribosomal protein S9 [Lentisphaerae bacterium RIFOXYA12_FULL_48_11]|nr:MAG: 30S ribosomal protein S9 [Lentisphaerae bacterium RIFOXYA12_FULL_48_11]